jgi:hypothetical protein
MVSRAKSARNFPDAALPITMYPFLSSKLGWIGPCEAQDTISGWQGPTVCAVGDIVASGRLLRPAKINIFNLA